MRRIVNPLPQLLPRRLARVRRELAGRVWERREPLAVLGGPLNVAPVPLEQATGQQLSPLRPGEHFGPAHGGWQTRWFRVDVPAPLPGEAGRRFLGWECDGETTIWLDGAPWAGLDAGHLTCPLPDRTCTLWLDLGTWETVFGVEPRRPIGPYGLRFDGCDLRVRDELAWQTFHDLDVLARLLALLYRRDGLELPGTIGYAPPLESVSPLLRLLSRGLEEALDAEARDGMPALHAALRALYARLPAEAWQPAAALIGHAHIDLVWLWPELATRRKALHSFATALRLMERYPEYTFAGSQPALYRMVEEQSPAQAAEIAARAREGRWDITGGFETEPDTNLPSGEALARSLVYGRRKIAQLRGAPSAPDDVCWLPDVFGYSTALPQILRLGGVTRFFTTKMTWSAVTRFPYTSFVWRGADGSEVLAHLCTTSYNGTVDLADVSDALRLHRQADVHPELLLPTGWGDGGGGTTEEMLERARRINDLAGVPRAAWTTTGAFFDRLEAVRDQLPVYQGELYLEYHRGTLTTQAEHKRLYRAAETALQAHEAARVATGGKPLGEDAWRRVLFNQFHDAIPGSSIREVYADLNPELAAITARELDVAAAELATDASGVTAFNPLPLARTVTVDGPGGARLALRLSPLGGVPFALQDDIVMVGEIAPDVLDNGIVRATFDAAGQLAGLAVDGVPLELTAPCAFVLYHDHPAEFDAWDIDHDAFRTGTSVATDLTLRVEDLDAAGLVLRGTAAIGERSTLAVAYTLEAESRCLRVDLDIDWQETHKLLKLHVPTGYRGRWARYGAAFGSIQRPQQPGTPADEAMWEVAGSRWAAVTRDDGVGLALLAEARYGFACRDGNLSVSLLRSPTWPDPTADRGRHRIRLALGRHERHTAGAVLSTPAAADALFAPVVVTRGARTIPPRCTWDDLGSLVPSWALPSETGPGYIIRLHETDGSAGIARLRLPHPARSVHLVDLLEQPLGEPLAGDDTYLVPYRPYQIVSLLVRPP